MSEKSWHIAQINLARAVEPLDSPLLSEFMAALDEVNAMAEASPGFVWRLKSESGNATDIRAGNDPLLLVNLSVWESVDSLFDFVYRSSHTRVMARRREWFEKPSRAHLALFWIAAGTLPTLEQGMERLNLLDERGPSPDAFTFKRCYPAPGSAGVPRDTRPEPYCVGWG